MTSSSLSLSREDTRIQRLLAELSQAVANTPAEEIRAWGHSAAGRLGSIALRRTKRAALTVARISKFALGEVCTAWVEANNGQLGSHLRSRGAVAGQAAGSGMRAAGSAVADHVALVAKLRTDPKEAAPVLFGAVIGFLIGSGGFDADGGLPDLDLRAGIGAHRSIWTHSIVPGILFEAAILATLELARLVHSRLPEDHDPIWDRLARVAARFAVALVRGTHAGLAFHFVGDAAPDGMTTYKDLPISLPMEGHQAILGASAADEAVEAARPAGSAQAQRQEEGRYGSIASPSDGETTKW
jgi:hypothetical protein